MKITIAELQKLAKERGGKCLSKEYISVTTKLTWQCKKGHTWQAAPSGIKYAKSWCPVCAGMEKGSIQQLQKLAAKHGGQCLSKTYKDTNTPVTWRCRHGHQWQANPTNIKRGGWCPACAGVKKGTIEQMQEIAKERGGKCLSKIYINSFADLTWQCKDSHQWQANPANIKKGTWCPDCVARRTLTIEEMQKIAAKRGGKCLSRTYINNHTKLIWQCIRGHRWESTPHSIKQLKTWCPLCAHKTYSS